MDWSQKEENGAAELWGSTIGKGGSFRDAMRAVMSRAVELVAARGGTMTAEALKTLYADMERWWEQEEVDRLAGHITAQGATVATLQAKVEELEKAIREGDAGYHVTHSELLSARAEMERLNGWREKCINDNNAWAARLTAAESRLAAILERAKDAARWLKEAEAGVVMGATGAWDEDVHADIMSMHALPMLGRASEGVIRWVLEGDAPQEAKDDGRAPRALEHVHLPDEMTHYPAHYPCSSTCTHDDAATPSHPERVKERSERLNDALFRADDDNTAADSDAYDRGAEDMRAACCEAVDALFVNQGLLNLRAALKAAIEGAAP